MKILQAIFAIAVGAALTYLILRKPDQGTHTRTEIRVEPDSGLMRLVDSLSNRKPFYIEVQKAADPWQALKEPFAKQAFDSTWNRIVQLARDMGDSGDLASIQLAVGLRMIQGKIDGLIIALQQQQLAKDSVALAASSQIIAQMKTDCYQALDELQAQCEQEKAATAKDTKAALWRYKLALIGETAYIIFERLFGK